MNAASPTDPPYMTVKEMVSETRGNVAKLTESYVRVAEFIAVMTAANLPERMDYAEKVQDQMATKMMIATAAIGIIVGAIVGIITSVVASQILEALRK